MYRHVPQAQIFDALIHLRDLHRQIQPTNDRERRAFERREVVVRYLLSNLKRMGEHPTLKLLLGIADIFSLTIEGAHRLFGYDLGEFSEYDRLLNSARTHIVESYPFERDQLVDLPLRLSSQNSFSLNATLAHLVAQWQHNIPIRALKGPTWRAPRTFYIHVGTEDSLESNIPPGAMALVEPIGELEAKQPNPRHTYLLQFRNGYRCSQCVVTRGKLHLLRSARHYSVPKWFAYPGDVRIAGRIRMFAIGLPSPEYRPLALDEYTGNAPLILPWEHRTRDRLLATGNQRFKRTQEQIQRAQDLLRTAFGSEFSERTRRRYRRPGVSEPHVHALLHLTLFHFARYTDSLRAGGYVIRDSKRFSLDTLLAARNLGDLADICPPTIHPEPKDVWGDRRNEFVEWPPMLSVKFPEPRRLNERLVRLANTITHPEFHPALEAGSWVLLEDFPGTSDVEADLNKRGWSRPLYVLRRGGELFFGRLESHGERFVLLRSPHEEPSKLELRTDELANLSRVCGIAAPL